MVLLIIFIQFEPRVVYLWSSFIIIKRVKVTKMQSTKDHTLISALAVLNRSKLSKRHLVIWQFCLYPLIEFASWHQLLIPGCELFALMLSPGRKVDEPNADSLFAPVMTPGFYLHHVEVTDQDPASCSLFISRLGDSGLNCFLSLICKVIFKMLDKWKAFLKLPYLYQMPATPHEDRQSYTWCICNNWSGTNKFLFIKSVWDTWTGEGVLSCASEGAVSYSYSSS